MTNKVQTVDEYLQTLSEEIQKTLRSIRKQIQSAAPEASEGISYNIPTFKLDGRPLVSFAAAKKHCAFYVLSPKVISAFKEELKDFDFEGGAIRFVIEKPLPQALVVNLVKARIAEIKK